VKNIETVVLYILVLGILLLSIGSFIYLRNIIVELDPRIEFQIILLGFFMVLLALIISKILARLEIHGKI
jgi:hypothetical protein